MIDYLSAPLSDIRMRHSERTDDEIATAYHEAGHAVVMLGFGFRVSSVTIEPSEGRSGLTVYNDDVRGYGNAEQRTLIYAAGRAGEELGPYALYSRNRDTWIQSTEFAGDVQGIRNDIQGIREYQPTATDDEIRDLVATAKRCIRAWEGTFANIVRALLSRGTLDFEEVLACVPSSEYQLRSHWQQFQPELEEPTPVAQQVTGDVRSVAVSTLERIQEAQRNGKGLPPRVLDLLTQLERSQGVQGGRFEPKPVIRYADPVPYETRVAG